MTDIIFLLAAGFVSVAGTLVLIGEFLLVISLLRGQPGR